MVVWERGWGEERLNVCKIVQRQGLYVTNPPLFPQFMIKIGRTISIFPSLCLLVYCEVQMLMKSGFSLVKHLAFFKWFMVCLKTCFVNNLQGAHLTLWRNTKRSWRAWRVVTDWKNLTCAQTVCKFSLSNYRQETSYETILRKVWYIRSKEECSEFHSVSELFDLFSCLFASVFLKHKMLDDNY